MAPDKITRRKFVAGATGAATAAMIVPRHVLGGPGYQAPSDQLNFAVIGCGGQGKSDAAELLIGGENLVALADIDFGFVDREVASRTTDRFGKPNELMLKVQAAYKQAKRYVDFRKLLEQQKDVDAVVIATPDHTHAVIAKAAMELGKHVYLEKPMTYSVYEARVLRETANRTKVITQMGNMGHSSHGAALINEWVQAGVIGAVREVQIWTNRPVWPQGVPRPGRPAVVADAPASQMPAPMAVPTPAPAPVSGGAAGAPPVPPANPSFAIPPGGGGINFGFGTDWNMRLVNRTLAAAMDLNYPLPEGVNCDLFLGPAPEVPYHPIYHPFNWRGWLEWGTGAIGDMAAHLLDHPYWALGLTYPISVEATSTPWGIDTKNNPVSFPLATQVVYRFPARGSQPPVTITWNDGGLMPPRPELLPDAVPLDRGGGVIFIGEKGILLHGTYGENPRLFPESLMEAAAKVPKTYPRIEIGAPPMAQPKHRMNWANAIKGKDRATCSFEYASRLTETMLLGVVALRVGQGRRILYDGETGKITNLADANRFLHREYRQGWTL